MQFCLFEIYLSTSEAAAKSLRDVSSTDSAGDRSRGALTLDIGRGVPLGPRKSDPVPNCLEPENTPCPNIIAPQNTSCSNTVSIYCTLSGNISYPFFTLFLFNSFSKIETTMSLSANAARKGAANTHLFVGLRLMSASQ